MSVSQVEENSLVEERARAGRDTPVVVVVTVRRLRGAAANPIIVLVVNSKHKVATTRQTFGR